jgi:hypothetical protein
MPDLEIKGQNGAVYRVVFAVDPANPNKLYRGYIQEGSDVDTITLNAVCNTANKNADLQSFLQVK